MFPPSSSLVPRFIILSENFSFVLVLESGLTKIRERRNETRRKENVDGLEQARFEARYYSRVLDP